MMELHRYPDAASMCETLAATLAGIATPEPAFALAGGKTPLPVYRALAERWTRDGRHARVVPTDDRCVAHADPASNIAALRAAFGDSAECVAITAADGDAAESLAVARAALEGFAGFDAVLLGMGEVLTWRA